MTKGPTQLGDRLRRRKQDFLGIGLSTASLQELMSAIEEALTNRSRLTISFLNPDYATKAFHDSELRGLINRFDLVLSDGWGVVWGARYLGVRVPERLANDDIGRPLFRLLAELGTGIFLFGSAPGVAQKARSTLTREFPRLRIVDVEHGWHDVARGHPGWYEDADNEMLLNRINASHADFLLVSVPTPQQQRWVWRNIDRLKVSVVMTGGSYLDHIAERLDWYPSWVLTFRLGWLYRLYREPRRLWKRYSLGLLEYAWIVEAARRRRAKRRVKHRQRWP